MRIYLSGAEPKNRVYYVFGGVRESSAERMRQCHSVRNKEQYPDKKSSFPSSLVMAVRLISRPEKGEKHFSGKTDIWKPDGG